MARTPTRFDIDDDEFRDTSEDEVGFVPVGPIFGRDWKILTDVNTFTILASTSDPSNYADLIVQAIHPDDQTEFLRLLKRQRSFSGEKLLALANKIVEAASGGNPTNSSGASSAGTPKKVAARRSAAR